MAAPSSVTEPAANPVRAPSVAPGWTVKEELAGLEERREGGDGRTYWDAAWSLTTYTFKRLVRP